MEFINVVIPVVVVAAVGFAFGRWTKLDTAPLTRLSFYVLTPALIFHAFVGRSISTSDLADAAVFASIIHVSLLLLALVGVRWMRWDADTKTAAVLSFSFNNCGNYGLPVLLFAFGEPGFSLGVAYMVAHVVYQVLLGVGIASWRKGMSAGGLAVRILRVPWLYAFGLAMLVRALSVDLPTAIARPIDLVAAAAIPVQLLLLGMSLSRVRIGGLLHQAVPVSLAKLVVPPLLAWGGAAALGIDGLLRSVLIIEASTPTAVNALILSLQYRRRPELTASVVMMTTLGGLATTGLLLWLLR